MIFRSTLYGSRLHETIEHVRKNSVLLILRTKIDISLREATDVQGSTSRIWFKYRVRFFCQDANDCDGEIRELREHQQALSMELEQKQINCQQLEGTSDTLDGDIDRLLEQKQRVRI